MEIIGKWVPAHFSEELPNTETSEPWPGLTQEVVSSPLMEAFKVQLCQEGTAVGRMLEWELGDSALPYPEGLGRSLTK